MSNSWSFTYTLSVEPSCEYNVSLSVYDVWGNTKLKSTLVRCDLETETVPFDYKFSVFSILILSVAIFRKRAKKRKD